MAARGDDDGPGDRAGSTCGRAQDATQGPVIGFVEAVADGQVLGWAWRPDRPQRPVVVEAVIDGAVVARAEASVFRADLAGAGVGDGGHGFSIRLPRVVATVPAAAIAVRVAGTHLLLPSLGRPTKDAPPDGDRRAPVADAGRAGQDGQDGASNGVRAASRIVVTGLTGDLVRMYVAADLSPDDIEGRVGRDLLLTTRPDPDRAEPLLVGNQLCNGDFAEGTRHWAVAGARGGRTLGTDHPEWRLENGHTAYVRMRRGDPPGDTRVVHTGHLPSGLIPVAGGAAYRLSGRFGMHRCSGGLEAVLFDGSLAEIGRFAVGTRTRMAGGAVPDAYEWCGLDFAAPVAARHVRIEIVQTAPDGGGEDAFLFFTHLWFGRVPSGPAEALGAPGGPASAWTPPPFSIERLRTLWTLSRRGLTAMAMEVPPAQRSAGGALRILDRTTGVEAIGSPLLLASGGARGAGLAGGVDPLDGTVLVGWVATTGGTEDDAPVSLLIDGRDAGSVQAPPPDAEGRRHFRLPIPADFLDGLPHRLVLCAGPRAQVLHESAAVLPRVATPWSALQVHARTGLPAALSGVASLRYNGLRRTLTALARARRTGEDFGQSRGEAAASAWLDRLAQVGEAHERVLSGLERPDALHPLVFPAVRKPLVSVVIPVHDKFAVTHNCLSALLLAYNAAPFEVIVVDDGSTDETLEIASRVKGVTVVRHDRAKGFVDACNAGVAAARGSYVALLNNDTEATAGWLDELLFVFRNFDDVGLAGSRLIYPDGRLQEAGGIVWSSGDPANYGSGGNPHEPRFCYTREADYVSGAALMMPRALWRKLGGLSLDMRPGYFEDTDLAFKVRAAGKRVVYAPFSTVIHYEGVTGGTDTTAGMKRFQEVNRPKFKRKWAEQYRFHAGPEDGADLAKDRGVRFRALFIDQQTPRLDNDAGSHAAIQEMRLVQALGFKATFAAANMAHLGTHTEALQRAGIEVLHAPFFTSIEQVLETGGAEFDLVYVTRYAVAERYIDLIRTRAPRAKILFCNADLHFLREMRDAVGRRDKEALAASLATREAELSVMRRVDVTLSYSEVEHAVILSHNLDSTKVVACPWVVDTATEVPGFAARRDVAFLGGFGHPPNLPAVRFFAREVMPLLRPLVPGIRFHIHGSQMTEAVRELAEPDVLVHGFAPDLAAVYDGCRVFVAPLTIGAGLKGKVIDALARGTPSVLSPIALESTGIREGVDALVALTPQEWAAAVAALHDDEDRWTAMSRQARDFARRHYGFARGLDLMRQAVEAAGLFPGERPGLVTSTARGGAARD